MENLDNIAVIILEKPHPKRPQHIHLTSIN